MINNEHEHEHDREHDREHEHEHDREHEQTRERTIMIHNKPMRRFKLTPEELAVVRICVLKYKIRGLEEYQRKLVRKLGRGDFFMVLYTNGFRSVVTEEKEK